MRVEQEGDAPAETASRLLRSVTMVGLMGAGKTAVGRRLARALDAPFHDADDAIVEAAGMSIPDIFELYGEPAFRDLERRVVARLLEDETQVLALGGGAFMDPLTRRAVRRDSISIWLKADLDTLVARTAKRKGTRPLLTKGDPRVILGDLIAARYPVYAEADHVIETGDQPPEEVVERIQALLERLGVVA